MLESGKLDSRLAGYLEVRVETFGHLALKISEMPDPLAAVAELGFEDCAGQTLDLFP